MAFLTKAGSFLANRFPKYLGRDSALQKAYRASAIQIEGKTADEKIADMARKLWRFDRHADKLRQMAQTPDGADHINFWADRINDHNKARLFFALNASGDLALVPINFIKYPSMALNIATSLIAHANSHQARAALLRGPFQPDEPPRKSDYSLSRADWYLGLATLGLYLAWRKPYLRKRYERDFQAYKTATASGFKTENRRYEHAALIDNRLYKPMYAFNAAEKCLFIDLPAIPVADIVLSKLASAFSIAAGVLNLNMAMSSAANTVTNLERSGRTKDEIIATLERQP